MQELLQGILYGFYVAEVIWKITDTGLKISKIRSKHPRRFSFSTDRQLMLLTPDSMIEGEDVPERKFIQFSFGSSDNPYGEGLGQSLWWPVWFKKHGIKFWMVFLEKFGMPTAVGKYPTGTDATQQAALLAAIDAIQNETGVKIPDTMAIELLEATRSGNVTYESLCEYMDKQISKRVLGQTATTEGTPGKLGNEDAQSDVRQDYLESDAGLLCECLNETIVRWIVDYNFSGVTQYPKLEIRVQEEKDLKPQAERDKILVSDIRLPVSKKYFYDTYGIDKPDEDEDVVVPQINNNPAGITPQEVKFADAKPKGKTKDIIDIYADRIDKESSGLVADLIDPVRNLIENAESLEAVRDGLFDLYPEMDASDLGALMQKAFTAAKLLGRYEVDNGG
jgi:phage gp29-like protein